MSNCSREKKKGSGFKQTKEEARQIPVKPYPTLYFCTSKLTQIKGTGLGEGS